MDYELLDLYRDPADGKLKGHVRYESGLEAVREVRSVEIQAKVHRAQTGQTEDLGIVAATYRNDGGTVTVPEHETLGDAA